jgi:hypothetical protein
MVKKALLIGINYTGTENSLNGCINDVNHIKTFLIENCGYLKENITLISDQESVKPTKDNMEKTIKSLVDKNVAGDTLFFYYSGHGSKLKDYSGDENDGMDEVLVPLDYEKAGIISDDWLSLNLINKVNKDVTLWCFTDCCHSGTMVDLKYNYKSLCELKNKNSVDKNYNPSEWNDVFSFSIEKSSEVPGNVYLFSGCQDAETSTDASINNKSQGAFTFCLLEFLKSPKFKNGNVKLRNILKEINCRLKINGFCQNSQLSLSKREDFEKVFQL